MFVRGKRMHSAQQRPEIGLHGGPPLADRLHRSAAAEVQAEFVLFRNPRFSCVRWHTRNTSRWQRPWVQEWPSHLALPLRRVLRSRLADSTMQLPR